MKKIQCPKCNATIHHHEKFIEDLLQCPQCQYNFDPYLLSRVYYKMPFEEWEKSLDKHIAQVKAWRKENNPYVEVIP